jgi:hypothetical protein
MKRSTNTTIAPLTLLLLGAFTVSLGLAATPAPEAAPPSQESATPTSPMPATGSATEQIMPDKAKQACARLDKDHSGYLTTKEFKGIKQPLADFKSADLNHDGRLDMQECAKVLKSS